MNNSYSVRIEPTQELVGKSIKDNEFYVTKFRFVFEQGTLKIQAEGRKVLSGRGMSKVEGEVQYNFPRERVPEPVWDELRTSIEASIERDMGKYEAWDAMVEHNRPALAEEA